MNSPIESPLVAPPRPTVPGAQEWHGHASDDVGATSGPLPRASLTATDQELLVVCPRDTYRVPRAAVTRVGRGSLYPWLFGGLRIHHDAPGLSKELQFKPLGTPTRDVLQQLRALGYPVR